MSAYNYKFIKEYSFPWDTASGRYYWTQTFYFESDYADPRDDPSVQDLIFATAFSVATSVRQERFRLERAYGGGTFLYEEVMGNNGALSGFGRGGLTNSIFVWSNTKNNGWWYKRFRGCLRASDMVGGVLGSQITTLFQQNVLDVLANVPLTNYQRVPVGDLVLSPKVLYLVLRNGTLRRARSVLGPYL